MSDLSAPDSDAVDLGDPATPTVITPPGSLTIRNKLRAAHKRLFGRGPTDIRVWFVQPDTIVMLLTGTLTASERSLLDIDRPASVTAARNALYEALEPELRVILEQELHRKTKAFTAGIDLERDVVSLVVTLG